MDGRDNPIANIITMSKKEAPAQAQPSARLHDGMYFWWLLLSGALLRIFQLGSRPMWYDEAIAALVSRAGVKAIVHSMVAPVAGASSNVHPPFYFSTLWAWMELFGESPLAVRSLSVVCSMVVMIFLWDFAKSLFGRRAALFVLALYAFSPFQVHYGQEARMYVMLSMFLLIATWAMWKLMDGGKWYFWIVLGFSSALAMYTQVLASVYLTCLYLVPVLMRRWDRIKEPIFAGIFALVLYLPWMTLLPSQFSRIQAGYWVERPGALELVQTLLSFNTGLPLQGLWLPMGLALSILFVVLLFWHTYKMLVKRGAHSQYLLALITLSILPVVLLFILSQAWPVYIVRALLPSGVIYLLWIATLLAGNGLKVFDRSLMWVVLIAIFAVGLLNHYSYRGFPYAPFEEINTYLESELEDGGIVIHSNKLSMLPAYYYDQELPQTFLADKPGSGSDTLAGPTQEVIGIHAQPTIQEAVGDHRQIFFVIFSRELVDYESAGIENHPALEYLKGHFDGVSERSFGDVSVYQFRVSTHSSGSG